jgi:hypothetical protein
MDGAYAYIGEDDDCSFKQMIQMIVVHEVGENEGESLKDLSKVTQQITDSAQTSRLQGLLSTISLS